MTSTHVCVITPFRSVRSVFTPGNQSAIQDNYTIAWPACLLKSYNNSLYQENT